MPTLKMTKGFVLLTGSCDTSEALAISDNGKIVAKRVYGGDGPSSALFLTCSGTPPLRQRQRDDAFNAPRVNRGPGHNHPRSLQYSQRSSWTSNTYLQEQELEPV